MENIVKVGTEERMKSHCKNWNFPHQMPGGIWGKYQEASHCLAYICWYGHKDLKYNVTSAWMCKSARTISQKELI